MVNFLRTIIKLAALLLLISVVGCGGNTAAPGNGSGNNDTGSVALGVIDGSGGATIYSSSGSYTLSVNQFTSGTVTISGGTPGFTGTMTMSVNPPSTTSKLPNSVIQGSITTLPSVELSNCTLVAGSANQISCFYSISTTDLVLNGASLLNGNYSIIPTFTTTSTSTTQVLNPINLTITDGVDATAGELSIIADYPNLIADESTTAIVTLSGSIGIAESINVDLASTNTNVLTVTPTSCALNTTNNSCLVNITGLTNGSANITVSANGYTTTQAELAVSNPNSYVYVANSGQYNSSISMYKMNPNTGNLIPLNPPSITLEYGTQRITSDMLGHYIYVTNVLNNVVLIFSIESNSGLLTPFSFEPTVATESFPLQITLDPTGHYAYVLTLTTIDMYNVTSGSGILTPLSPESSIPDDGAGTSWIIVDPTGQYFYSIDSQHNMILMYSLVPGTGLLKPLNPLTIPTGNFPVGITISHTGKYVYVVNDRDNTVSMYCIESGSGLLNPLNPESTVTTGSAPNAIAIDPTGRYAYVPNTNSQSVSMYSVNPSTGILTALNPATIPTGSAPWLIVIDPSGQYVYVTNKDSNSVSMYSINQDTGVLTALSIPTVSTGLYPFGIAIATPSSNGTNLSFKK